MDVVIQLYNLYLSFSNFTKCYFRAMLCIRYGQELKDMMADISKTAAMELPGTQVSQFDSKLWLTNVVSKLRNLSKSSELNRTVEDLNEREYTFFNTFGLKGKLRNHEPNSTASCVCRVLNIQVLICTRNDLINHQKRLQ